MAVLRVLLFLPPNLHSDTAYNYALSVYKTCNHASFQQGRGAEQKQTTQQGLMKERAGQGGWAQKWGPDHQLRRNEGKIWSAGGKVQFLTGEL